METKQSPLRTIALEQPECTLLYQANFLSRQEADTLLRWAQALKFEDLSIKLYGKVHVPSRKTMSFADQGLSYSYSGTTSVPHEWPDELVPLRKKLAQFHPEGAEPTFVLLNYYKDGEAYISWHTDDEKGLQANAPILSVSVGAPRDFLVRQKKPKVHEGQARKSSKTTTVPLAHGSLCIMGGKFQSHYEHSVPIRKRCKMPRVNFTFRYMKKEAANK